mgnify:CR=1 FL=1
MADIQHVSDDSFESDVINSDVPVLWTIGQNGAGPAK